MKLLLTAFDPFGGETINPALETIKHIKKRIGRIKIVTLEVPTVFYTSRTLVDNVIEKEKPDVIVSLGQAGGRFDITPERVAINCNDANIPDNEGNQPLDETICADGPPAYFSTLPIKAIVENIRALGIPAGISNSAGTFVCNHLMYGILYTLERKYPHARGGFIHVPFMPAQTIGKASPSLSLSDIQRGIEAAIETIDGL